MEKRKIRRRHLNPRIKAALETIAMAVGGVAIAAMCAQMFGIALGLIVAK